MHLGLFHPLGFGPQHEFGLLDDVLELDEVGKLSVTPSKCPINEPRSIP